MTLARPLLRGAFLLVLAFTLAWGICSATQETEAVAEEPDAVEAEESSFGWGDLLLVGLGLGALFYLYGRRKTEEPK